MPTFTPPYKATGSLHPPTSPTLTLHSTAIPPLTLRLPTASDLPALTAVLSNPANTKDDLSVSKLTSTEREDLCRKWLTLTTPLTHLNFLILHASFADPIGIVGLGWIGPAHPAHDSSDASNDKPETSDDSPDVPRAGAVGVVLNPEARGKGFAYEALRMSVDYGLRELGLVEVRVGTPRSNVAMRGLMERRFGMRAEESGERDRFGNDLFWRIGREWIGEGEGGGDEG